jgi:hypothetical protein
MQEDISRKKTIPELAAILEKYNLQKIRIDEKLSVGSHYYIGDTTGIFPSPLYLLMEVIEIGPVDLSGKEWLSKDEYRGILPLLHINIRNMRMPDRIEEIIGVYQVPPEKVEPL